MDSDITPYVPRNPGDLITAGDWNDVQVDVKKDIAAAIQTAVAQVNDVQHAGDADKLGGKTPDQLTQDIINQVLAAIPGRTGYQMLFKRLKLCEEKVIKHDLKAFPLVDVYQLEYFKAVCAKGETAAEETPEWVNLYLYHTGERRIRIPGQTPAQSIVVDIEPPDTQPYKVPFAEMLNQYGVKYTDTTSLDDLETDFWTAFFNSPNDEFDPDQYCHSPWFERCCGEKRSVKELKDRGDWDDIWLKMEPRKTINYPDASVTIAADGKSGTAPPGSFPLTSGCLSQPAPTQIEVTHRDLDTLAVKLLAPPVYAPDFPGTGFTSPPDYKSEAKVMVLLKV
jgi:hypothetical protein